MEMFLNISALIRTQNPLCITAATLKTNSETKNQETIHLLHMPRPTENTKAVCTQSEEFQIKLQFNKSCQYETMSCLTTYQGKTAMRHHTFSFKSKWKKANSK